MHFFCIFFRGVKVGLTLALAVSVVTMSYAKSYGVWVMGVQVTSQNRTDILGDGTMSFEPCANPNGTLEEKTSRIVFHGGTISVPFAQTAGKFTYDCFLFVPYSSQSSWTKNTTASYSADEYIKNLEIVVENDNYVFNALDETAMDAIHHEGIFTRVPTTFMGTGTLHLKGFNHFTIHVKDDVIFESGRYILENTLVMEEEDGSEWHTCIYQEGDNYTLTFKDAFFKLSKGGDWYSSVIFGGSVNSNGIGAHVSMAGYVYKDVYYTSRNLITREWGSGANAIRLKNVYIYPKNYPIKVTNKANLTNTSWITWDNHNDVLSDGGSVRYDLENNRLFLDNANIQLNQQQLSFDVDSMAVYCFGTNHITGSYDTEYMLQGKKMMLNTSDLFNYFAVPDSVGVHEYKSTGNDSLIITSTNGNALKANIDVADNMTLVCQSPATKDAFYGKVTAQLKIDEGNTAIFGKEVLYPLAIGGKQLNQEGLRVYQQKYGNKFQYDPATNTLRLNLGNEIFSTIAFMEKGTLIINGKCSVSGVKANKDLNIICNDTLRCICTTVSALQIGVNATVTISGGGLVHLQSSTHSVSCGGLTYSGNLVVDNTKVYCENTSSSTETIHNIGSLILKKAVITTPVGAQFVASKNSVCVNRVPTTANVVIAPTTSDAMISEVTLTADVPYVLDQEDPAHLSAFVKGNGTAKLYAQWYRKDDDDQWWWTSGSQITISATDALAGKTLEKTFSANDENSAYMQYRLMVRTGNTTGDKDTLYSNVLEMPIAYKVQLLGGGYNYWLNDEVMGHEILEGESEDLWILSSDSVQVDISNDCAEDLGNTNLYPWYDLGDGRYSFTNVKHSVGSVNTYWKKLDIKFYSSRKKSSATLIQEYSSLQPNPFVCGDSFDSRGRTVPTAPEKESPFVGWLEEGKDMLYTSAKLQTRFLGGNKVFIAMYEEDFETALTDVPAEAIKSEKFLYNGQVYILHNNKLYNVSGLEIK